MKKYYDTLSVVYIYEEEVYGTIDSMGAYASKVKFEKDGKNHEEIINNEDFLVIDEIVFTHIEEN
jgi:hypothetical protein